MKVMTMCKFDFSDLPTKFHNEYPFTKKDVFIYMGDITNMSGHCVVVRTKDNVIFTCYHTDDFVELNEDEL
jgi:hypothetical protein